MEERRTDDSVFEEPAEDEPESDEGDCVTQ